MSDTSEHIDYQSRLKRALLALQELRSKLDAIERLKTEPIAIIGIGCRFPGGANDPEAFWQLLHDGVDAITEVPLDRWDVDAYYDPAPDAPGKMYTRHGGFLEHVDKFDPQFFGISPREAVSMDPQQRLLLEVSWEALENAGQASNHLVGSRTGVFVGIMNLDYSQLTNDPNLIDAHTGTGNTYSTASGRLSYFLDLRGASISVDTACSSSLVAIHLACQNLRNGDCNLALAGGVNLILSPVATITECRARMLAADGRCKTFDAAADGFVRGEGCGMVVLKRLSDALADGDNILALIRGSAVNHDGRSGGLTVPNGPAQEAVIREALNCSRVEPGQVSYVEAHGTGTSLGDPIEVRALGAVLGEGRLERHHLAIGTVKTNIGHLEAAAGVAGLIKVVLALQHKEIPPHLHLQQLNPYISWEEVPVVIPTQLTPWLSGNARCIAGVSSFGFSGTNAHVVLEEAPIRKPEQAEVERPFHLFNLSAKSEEALKELARRYEAFLEAHPVVLPGDVCFTTNTGRSHFTHRLAVTAESTVQMREQLEAFAAGSWTAGLVSGQVQSWHHPKIVFLFSGQGSQYVGMGRQLYETQPTFRKTLERCDQLLRPYLEQPLLSVLYPAPDVPTPLNETAYTQSVLFALEYALAELWRSWGIVPDAVMGHSVGEYVAACLAGVFSLEDGLKLIAEHSRLMQALPKNGQMAAVFANEEQVTPAIAPFAHEVAIAAVNGPENIVISGAQEAVQAVLAQLKAEGIAVQCLQVSHAFHSPLIEPMLDAFKQVAHQVQFKPPHIPLISNLTGQMLKPGEILDESYWCRQIREVVQFRAGIQSLSEQGYNVWVELAPQPTLLGLGQRCLSKDIGTWLPSLKKGQDDWQVLLASLGKLYVKGINIDWAAFDRDYRRSRIPLPTYPFKRERYWIESPQIKHYQTRRRLPEHSQENDELYEVQWQAKGRLDQASVAMAPDYILAPRQITERLQSEVARLRAQHQLERYQELWLHLNVLSAAYVLNTFQQLGWQPCLHQRISLVSLAKQLGVVSQHHRLFGRMIEILHEEGVLKQIGSEWKVCRVSELENPQHHWDVLFTQYPACKAELKLVGRCGQQLADVLRGDCDPLHLLFPEGSLTTAEMLYQDSPFAQMHNTLVQEVIAKALERLPAERTVRILEIGAGTGGTTSYVISRLPAERTNYIFSDISNLFMSKAEQKFHRYPFVQYQLLDIERDPQGQGFASHQFDLVLAANVLHATSDLRQTLRHVQQLLAPEGLLVLLEGTKPQRWLDLTFGLTEGWWKFTDVDLRPSYPLLSRHKWRDLLEEIGFTEVATLPDLENGEQGEPEQSVILAQGPQLEQKAQPVAVTPGTKQQGSWLIFADRQGGVGQNLLDLLKLHGEHGILVFPSEAYECIDQEHYSICPERPENVRQILEVARKPHLSPCRGIVYLWSLDALPPIKNPTTALEPAWEYSSVLLLCQELERLRWCETVCLWLVAQGSQSLVENAVPLALAPAPLWQVGRMIAQEHPTLWRGLVDLDPGSPPWKAAALLWEEIWNPDGEDQLAFRQGQRYVARLLRQSESLRPAVPPRKASLNRDALLTVAPEERQQILKGYLREQVVRVLRLSGAKLDMQQPLNSLGLDSLLAIELKNQIELDLKITVPMASFFQNFSVAQLTTQVLNQLTEVTGEDWEEGQL